MSGINSMSDELLGELFRSLVLKSLEDLDPTVLSSIFHGTRGDDNEAAILTGIRGHNDRKHQNLQSVAGLVKRGQAAPVAPSGDVPRLPSGRKDIFGSASREVKQLFKNKK